MEIKKTKQANLENKKKSFFLFGLMTSLGFILMAFEWAAYDVDFKLPSDQLGPLVEVEPAAKTIEIIRPKPKSISPLKIDPPITTHVVLVKKPEVIVQESAPKPKKGVEIITQLDDSVFGEEKFVPVIDTIVNYASVMPSYPGGDEQLFKDLTKNLKKNRFGIKGKVIIEFVVEKNGEVSNVIIKKAAHESLNKNALNAVKQLKKWTPGEQNYRPVRVRMTLPINFVVR